LRNLLFITIYRFNRKKKRQYIDTVPILLIPVVSYTLRGKWKLLPRRAFTLKLTDI